MAGVPRKIQASVPVPLLDGIGCGVRQAEVLARLGVPKPTVGSYALPPQREMVAVSPAIERMFGPRTS
jgi:allantoin racemase